MIFNIRAPKQYLMKTTFGSWKLHREWFYFKIKNKPQHFQAWISASHILFTFHGHDMSLRNGATLGYVGMSCYSTLENMMCWHTHAWPLSKWHVRSWQFRKKHISFSVQIFCMHCNLHMQSVKDRKKPRKEILQSWSQIMLYSAFIQIHISVFPYIAHAEYSAQFLIDHLCKTKPKQIQIIIFEY